ncbi:MAG: hypothetical protein KC454_10575 [Flavobacteriales bacterium]|nr:hypothetical protein [Flavobacteriales bacterium]
MKFHLLFLFQLYALFSIAQMDAEIYSLLKEGTAVQLTNKINLLEGKIKKSNLALCYVGALKAKKSSYLTTPKEKVQEFKAGAGNIEKAIALDSKNVELIFLRYVIQCNSPKITRYKDKIDKDKYFLESQNKTIRKSLYKIIQDFNIDQPEYKINL